VAYVAQASIRGLADVPAGRLHPKSILFEFMQAQTDGLDVTNTNDRSLPCPHQHRDWTLLSPHLRHD
jgi:hypothetical protein